MREVANFPFDFALYFSTDHNYKGGIWLYVCDRKHTNSLACKSYDQAVVEGDFDYLAMKPPGNPIFRDKVQGYSTETPHANVINNTVYMTYHNGGAGRKQSTLLALSKDGVNFHRINGKRNSVILDYKAGDGPGDGHTGYFRWGPNPFSGVTSKYVGYSLHGGGPQPNFAMWVSDDAVDWRRYAVLKRQPMIENDGFIG